MEGYNPVIAATLRAIKAEGVALEDSLKMSAMWAAQALPEVIHFLIIGYGTEGASQVLHVAADKLDDEAFDVSRQTREDLFAMWEINELEELL